MMQVENICRCGNKLTPHMTELVKLAIEAARKRGVQIDPVESEYTTCSHCDNSCAFTRKSCSFCRAMFDSEGDSEYYRYQ
jgi:hypothetical protein